MLPPCRPAKSQPRTFCQRHRHTFIGEPCVACARLMGCSCSWAPCLYMLVGPLPVYARGPKGADPQPCAEMRMESSRAMSRARTSTATSPRNARARCRAWGGRECSRGNGAHGRGRGTRPGGGARDKGRGTRQGPLMRLIYGAN